MAKKKKIGNAQKIADSLPGSAHGPIKKKKIGHTQRISDTGSHAEGPTKKKNKKKKTPSGWAKGYIVMLDDLCFPVAPQKIEWNSDSANETVTLINGGEANRIKNPPLTDVTISDILIPRHKYPFARYDDNKFEGPKYFLDEFERMKTDLKPHRLIVSRASPDGKKMWANTSMLVTIESYKWTEDAEQGPDVLVDLTLKQYRKYGSHSLVKKKKKSKKSGKKKTVSVKKKKRASQKSRNATYKIKNGDTLRIIARKECNDESEADDIYKLNKNTLEKAAKKHGRKSSNQGFYIYPGTVIKIPKE